MVIKKVETIKIPKGGLDSLMVATKIQQVVLLDNRLMEHGHQGRFECKKQVVTKVGLTVRNLSGH